MRVPKLSSRIIVLEGRPFVAPFKSCRKEGDDGGGYFFMYYPTRISLRNLDLDQCWFRYATAVTLAVSRKPRNTGNKHNRRGFSKAQSCRCSGMPRLNSRRCSSVGHLRPTGKSAFFDRHKRSRQRWPPGPQQRAFFRQVGQRLTEGRYDQ